MDHLPIHIGMILTTLGLSPLGFVFDIFHQKGSYQLDVIHVYMLISLQKLDRRICKSLATSPKTR